MAKNLVSTMWESTLIRSKYRLLYLGLIVATLIAFHGVYDCGFTGDDDVYLTKNYHLQRGFFHGLQWAFSVDLFHTYPSMDYWQPVVWLSRMLDIQMFGFNPSMHHLMNLFFHILNSLILFHVLWKMTRRPKHSAMVAAFFAVHPLRVESVAWVTERKDMLSGFFWMLTLWTYSHYTSALSSNAPRKTILRRYLLVLFFFSMGLMSKPIVVTLPLVLLLLDYWPLKRLSFMEMEKSKWASVLMEKAPMFIFSAVSAVITLRSRGSNLNQPWEEGIKNGLSSYATYLVKTFYPHPLAIQYPHTENTPLWQAMGSGLLLLMISFFAIRWWKRFPFLWVGWCWFLGTLAPVIGLNVLTSADRFTYLPQIGIFIILAWGVSEWKVFWKWRQATLRIALGGALTACIATSAFQVRYWHDEISLYEHAIQVSSKNAVAYQAVGDALLEKGEIEKAMGYFKHSLQLSPNDPYSYNYLGVCCLRKGRNDKALEYLRGAIQIDPRFSTAYQNLGSALVNMGKTNEAIRCYHQAVRLNPDSASAHGYLGFLLFKEGRKKEAIQHDQEALTLNPHDAGVHNDLGNVLFSLGRMDEAVHCYLDALQAQPEFAQAWFNLGNSLILQNKTKEAADCYSQAVQIDPRFVEAHYNLAVCLVKLNDSKGAVQHLQKAVKLKMDFAPAREELEQLRQKGNEHPGSG